MKEQMFVTKYSGEVVPYDEKKLYNSLKQSGAANEFIQKILVRVRKDMVDKKSTAAIYKEAFTMLKHLSKATAARYKLKKSIMELGPSGFPFEKYVAELFRHQGYSVSNNLILKGKCVSHEVDVLAKRHDTLLFIECKFHNRQGLKSDVKVSMYFKARVDDLKAGDAKKKAYEAYQLKGCLVTNTRFSEDAIKYAKCEGIQLISWDYPINASLKEKIELSGLYPITCLSSLTKREKLELIESGHVMAKSIAANPALLKNLKMSDHRYENVLAEINELCVNY